MTPKPDRFTHLLLTPFNMRISRSPGLDPGWLAHRFDLFERFCYPSLRAQSNQDFRWLVFFDEDTPGEYKKRVEAFAAWDRFLPYYSRKFNDYREAVLENIADDATHLITTTLDNDDALARTFVDEVQRQFRGQAFQLVNFPAGLRLSLRRRRLYERRVPTNPFISLIEARPEAKTIRGCGQHDQMASRYGAIVDVDAQPLWLQVVHERNIAATGIWGCRRVPLDVLRGRFELGDEIEDTTENRIGIGLENLRRRAERLLIDRLSPSSIAGIRKALKLKRRR